MRYSTGQKKRLRLQGHRKRRKAPEVSKPKLRGSLSWTEYKTMRQYQTMGDLLDEFKAYGCHGSKQILTVVDTNERRSTRNGHLWLTKDPGAE